MIVSYAAFNLRRIDCSGLCLTRRVYLQEYQEGPQFIVTSGLTGRIDMGLRKLELSALCGSDLGVQTWTAHIVRFGSKWQQMHNIAASQGCAVVWRSGTTK